MAVETPVVAAPASAAPPASVKEPAGAPASKPVIPADADLKTKYEKLEADHLARKRELIIERRKWDAERKAAADKLAKLPEYEKKLSEFEKTQKAALRNPSEFLKSIYGDNWYDRVVEAKVSGVAPAELMAQELEKLEAKFEAKLSAKDAEAAKAREEAAKSQQAEVLKSFMREVGEFTNANLKDYPIFERLGSAEVVTQTIAARIRSEFERTTKKDEAGEVIQQGKVLSAKEAADLIENDLIELAKHALTQEKYKPKFAPAAPVDPKASKAGATLAKARKTLSNGLTASTETPKKPAVTDAERRARAIAAFNATAAAKAK